MIIIGGTIFTLMLITATLSTEALATNACPSQLSDSEAKNQGSLGNP
jgi:hypothetical protein